MPSLLPSRPLNSTNLQNFKTPYKVYSKSIDTTVSKSLAVQMWFTRRRTGDGELEEFNHPLQPGYQPARLLQLIHGL